MFIQCPSCLYGRDVAEDKIPVKSKYATCPKCKTRFHLPLRAGMEADYNPASPLENIPENFHDNYSAEQMPLTGHGPADNHVDSLQGDSSELNRVQPDLDASSFQHSSQNYSDEPEDAQASNHKAEWEQNPPETNWRSRQDKASAEEEKFNRIFGEHSSGMDSSEYSGAKRQPGFLANDGGVQWEYSGQFGSPRALMHIIVNSVSQPQKFFSGISSLGSIAPAFVYALLVFIIYMLVAVQKTIGVVTDAAGVAQEVTLLHLLPLPQLAVLCVFGLLVCLFLHTLIANTLVSLLGGRKGDFKRTFKVVCYSMTPLVFCIIPLDVIYAFSGVANFALMYIGLFHAFKINAPRVLIALALHIGVLLLLIAVLANHAARLGAMM